MLKQFSAGVVVYRQDEDNNITYLLLQYPRGPWDFPKGKLKEGETWKHGAHREMVEETGLNIPLDNYFEHSYAYTFNDARGNKVEKTVVFFVAKTEFDSLITLSQEHVDFLWLLYDQAKMQLKFDNVKHLLDQVNEYLERKYNL